MIHILQSASSKGSLRNTPVLYEMCVISLDIVYIFYNQNWVSVLGFYISVEVYGLFKFFV